MLRSYLRIVRRLVPVHGAAWRGRIVLCDRHPLDALAVTSRKTAAGRALERFLIGACLPRPDRVIVLDAPAATMFARKGEHSVEVLERWRRGYHDRLVPRGAVIIDTGGSAEEAVERAATVLWEALAARRSW